MHSCACMQLCKHRQIGQFAGGTHTRAGIGGRSFLAAGSEVHMPSIGDQQLPSLFWAAAIRPEQQAGAAPGGFILVIPRPCCRQKSTQNLGSCVWSCVRVALDTLVSAVRARLQASSVHARALIGMLTANPTARRFMVLLYWCCVAILEYTHSLPC